MREAANRITCTNNLKQIALAYHTAHDQYKGQWALTTDDEGEQLRTADS